VYDDVITAKGEALLEIYRLPPFHMPQALV
jgi:hypothetical protein